MGHLDLLVYDYIVGIPFGIFPVVRSKKVKEETT
jgi:hypothetical protein